MNKKSLDRSSENALRLKAIIETAIDGIITIDERGIVETVNIAAANLFGYKKDEMIGNNISMLMPNPYQKEHDGYIKRYVRTRKPRIIGIGREIEGMRKDGSVFPIRLAVSEIQFENYRIFTGIIHDMTEVNQAKARIIEINEKLEQSVKERTEQLAKTVSKLLATNRQLVHEIQERKSAEAALLKSERELRKALEKERELNDLKSRFVSMASHEFRTPLSSILSSAELIEAYTTFEQQQNRSKHTNRIKLAVTNLTGILNDFLSMSKLEEGKIQHHPVEFDLKDFCSNFIEEIQGMLKKGQYIRHEQPKKGLTVVLDKTFLKNILFNLLSNAIKYSGPDTPIDFQINLTNRNLIIKVIDYGIGIPKNDQTHLFSRFFRATNVENIQGTGLGLNIVRKYVDAMGGSINFESELGVGSTFIVEIPIQKNLPE